MYSMKLKKAWWLELKRAGHNFLCSQESQKEFLVLSSLSLFNHQRSPVHGMVLLFSIVKLSGKKNIYYITQRSIHKDTKSSPVDNEG